MCHRVTVTVIRHADATVVGSRIAYHHVHDFFVLSLVKFCLRSGKGNIKFPEILWYLIELKKNTVLLIKVVVDRCRQL